MRGLKKEEEKRKKRVACTKQSDVSVLPLVSRVLLVWYEHR
jgi:hypothetical protein